MKATVLLMALVAVLAAVPVCYGYPGMAISSGAGSLSPNVGAPISTAVLSLSAADRDLLAVKKVTCPFMGSVVNQGLLAVRNTKEAPLAKIADIAPLLNNAGGNLGVYVAKVLQLARNHNFLPNANNPQVLNRPVPSGGYISLDLSGSVGSHYGHSGILAGAPKVPNSGRFSQAEWDRFVNGYFINGHIARSAVGRLVGDNCRRDPVCVTNSELTHVIATSAWDLVKTVTHALTFSDPAQYLTDLTRASTLSVAANEWALGTAFFQHSPRTLQVNGEPAYSLVDLTQMFVHHTLPADYKQWRMNGRDWVHNAVHVNYHAAKQFVATRNQKKTPSNPNFPISRAKFELKKL